MVDHTHDELTEAFEYLDDLRESGVTNMFGASSYVVSVLGWPRTEARSATQLWMQTFSNKTVSDRVEEALAKE
jgi:hypothetical protein